MSRLNYFFDSHADLLAVTWGANQAAAGFEIHENIVLRLDLTSQKVVGLTFLNFSEVKRESSFRLLQIRHWIPEYRIRLLQLLDKNPLNQIFDVVKYANNLFWIEIKFGESFQPLIRKLS